MKFQFAASVTLVALTFYGCGPHQVPSTGAEHLSVTRSGFQPSTQGSPEHFTGSVVITPLFAATDYTRTAGASVAFESGAHTAWHTHPAGQRLIVTSGTGWVQEWGGPKQEIKPGDAIWTPPGVKHWHGATATSSMTHIAIQENVDGKFIDWMELVTDRQYRR